MLRRFWKNELGGSASEYALILAVVGPGIGAAALVLGANVKQSGSTFENNLDSTNAVAATTGGGGGGSPTPSPSSTSAPTPTPTSTSAPTPTPSPTSTSSPGKSGDCHGSKC